MVFGVALWLWVWFQLPIVENLWGRKEKEQRCLLILIEVLFFYIYYLNNDIFWESFGQTIQCQKIKNMIFDFDLIPLCKSKSLSFP